MDQNALLMVVLLIFVGGMLYLSSRTRKKQAAAQRQKLDAIAPGVRVTTIAGLQGTVTAVADDTMELEIAPGVRTTWLRAAVRDVVVGAPEVEFFDETADDSVDTDNSVDAADSLRANEDKFKKDLG
jgi:preprotein translocase subunit YajC